MAKEDKDIEIVHLKFPENIRKRPGMYIGGIDNADVILREVIDNSIDELFNCKNCNTVISNKQGDWLRYIPLSPLLRFCVQYPAILLNTAGRED